MSAWFLEIGKILEPLFGKPGSSSFMLLAFIACLTYLVIFRTAAKGFGVGLNDWPQTLIATGITVAAMLAVMVASRFYFPLAFIPENWREPVIALAVVLIVGLPVHCLLLKGNALKVFPAIVMGVIAGALMVILVTMIADAMKTGGDTISPARKHKREVEKMINR